MHEFGKSKYRIKEHRFSETDGVLDYNLVLQTIWSKTEWSKQHNGMKSDIHCIIWIFTVDLSVDEVRRARKEWFIQYQ